MNQGKGLGRGEIDALLLPVLVGEGGLEEVPVGRLRVDVGVGIAEFPHHVGELVELPHFPEVAVRAEHPDRARNQPADEGQQDEEEDSAFESESAQRGASI